MTAIRGVLLDIDGTLVDSNDAHARAWVDAFAKHGYHVSFDKVRFYVGMGGDNLIKAVIGLGKDDPQTKKLSEHYGEIFRANYRLHLRAFPGAKALVEHMHQQGLRLIAASSSHKTDVRALLDIVGITKTIDGFTSADDVDNSKPDPDILQVALDKGKLSAHEVVVVGDTPYDIEAAERTGIGCIAFRSGGWKERDLKGALEIYDGPADMLARYDKSVLARGYAVHR
jgi:HAD superfamily hydrolase (TIGR01509 family)